MALHQPPTTLENSLSFPLCEGDATFRLGLADLPTIRTNVDLFIGVRADDAVLSLPDAQCEFSFELLPNSMDNIMMDEVTPLPAEESSLCSHCSRPVPPANMRMHETFCQRNNFLCTFPDCRQVILRRQKDDHCHCPDCGTVFSSSELPTHCQYFHTPSSCQMCEAWSGNLVELRQHQRTACPQRLIRCRFCEDIVPSGGDPDDWRDKFHWGLCQHESICGSKTILCGECQHPIRRKEMEFHLQSHQPVAPLSSINEETPCHRKEQDSTDEPKSMECPICGSIQSSLRLLNSHLDTAHK